MDRKYRRDGETEYPEIGSESFVFEAEVAALNREFGNDNAAYDRVDIAMLTFHRYLRPVDIAKWHQWEEEDMLRGAFGRPSKSDKYGNRI